MKIRLAIKGCIGCGVCINNAPDNFCAGDDGLAKIKDSHNNIDLKAFDWKCPVSAIKISE